MANENPITKPEAEQPISAEHTRCVRHFRPNVDIFERDDELTVQADVPGVTSDNVDIEFDDGTLTIRARVEPRQEIDTEYLLREYEVGDYYRSFHVDESVDAEKISAECADGVLTLHLPKIAVAAPRTIHVKTG